MILDRTPFYAEGGGQLADNGVITAVGSGAADGARVNVTDVQTPLPGLIIHRGTVAGRRAGRWHAGARRDRRGAAPGHLPLAHGYSSGAPGVPRRAGGVRGAGRLGELARPVPVRLHRDGRGPASVLQDAEEEVNRVLINDLEVRAFHTSIDEARAMGALALFGRSTATRSGSSR